METFYFKWTASGLTIILNSLPIFAFIDYFKKENNFESIPSLKIFTNYVNCLIWYFYGSLIFNSSVKISYMISLIISLIFIIIYILNEIKRYLLDSILNCIILIIGTLASFEWFSHITLEKNLVGQKCIIMSAICIFVQMLEVYNGIKEKNYMLIRVNYSFIAFPTNLCWIMNSLIIDDYYILIANLMGIFTNIFVFLIYGYYKKQYPSINDGIEEPSTIDICEEPKKETKEKPVKIIDLKKI